MVETTPQIFTFLITTLTIYLTTFGVIAGDFVVVDICLICSILFFDMFKIIMYQVGTQSYEIEPGKKCFFCINCKSQLEIFANLKINIF